MSIWDDPDLRAGGDFVAFETVGDSIAGTIDAVRTHRFDDGKVVPQILMTTDAGEEKTLTAGQIRLKIALAEQRPEAGDHLTVTLTDIEKRSGGKTLKHFDVNVKRGGGQQQTLQQPPAQQQATPQPAQIDPAAAAAALANLTPEQKQALGL